MYKQMFTCACVTYSLTSWSLSLAFCSLVSQVCVIIPTVQSRFYYNFFSRTKLKLLLCTLGNNSFRFHTTPVITVKLNQFHHGIVMGKDGDPGATYAGQKIRNSKRKSKGRMSYLEKFKKGKFVEGKVDSLGQKYGDYVPAYGNRSRSNYSGQRRSKEFLKSGMKGFLCTTNFREKECVREAYNILNEYYNEEKLVESNDDAKPLVSNDQPESKPSMSDTKTGNLEEEEEIEDDMDIDDALASELKELQSDASFKKFQNVDTGVNNVVFIRTTIDDPTELAYKIFDDVVTKQTSKSRYLLRLLPVELTCNTNNIEDVKSKAKLVLEKYLKTGYNSFKIVVNARLNGKVKKDEYIKTLAEVVSQINPLNFVDLTNAMYTVVVEILKGNLCLAVVKNFSKFKKYNLSEAGAPNVSNDDQGEATKPEVAKCDSVSVPDVTEEK